MTIPLEKAFTAIGQTIDLAKKDNGAHVALAVVDAHGTLTAFGRMDRAPERVAAIARAKAYTAAKMTVSTEDFLKRLRDEHLAAEWFCDAGLTPLPGGVPIFENGICIGAVGVSGRTLADDVSLAKAFARLIETNA